MDLGVRNLDRGFFIGDHHQNRVSPSGPLLIIPSVGTTAADTMGLHARRVLRIGRGDITRWAADAIATSANAGLCGNRAPSYWRFQRRPDNIDGAVHAAAGPALATALSELADARGFPYSSPTSDAASYRGSLFPSATGGMVACPTGTAVLTRGFGLAHTKLVVHAVCPDGLFRTGPPGAAEALLRATYRSALREAVRAGAESCQ